MTIKDYFSGKVKYDEYGGGFLWDEKMHMIMDIRVRGWGRIQHLFKTENEAEKFQDEVGRFIAEAINEKLKELNKLVMKTINNRKLSD